LKEHRVDEFIDKEAIDKKVDELAARISADYKGQSVLCVGILNGSVIFMSDLVRKLEDVDVEMAFMQVSSYAGATTKSSGSVRVILDLDKPLKNVNVLLVEDIIDTGITLKHLTELFKVRGPKSFKICTLLDKPSRRLSNIKPEYVGFEIPDKFVVGYGLDYDSKYRNLGYIGIVNFDISEEK